MTPDSKNSLRAKILALRSQNPAQLFTLKELVHTLNIEYAQRRTLLAVLEELEESGAIYRVKRAKYAFSKAQRTVIGRLDLNPRGFGFVRPEASGGGDVFIGRHAMGYATHGDRVVVEVARGDPKGRQGSGGRKSTPRGKASRHPVAPVERSSRGRIVQVLERANERVIGRINLESGVVYLQPLDERLPFVVQLRGLDAARLPAGAIAVAEILIHPGRHTPALGKLSSIIGLPGDKDLPLKITLCKFDIPTEFSAGALAEAALFKSEVSAVDAAGRRDFRDWPTVTIDGETARDFDDAITLEEFSDGNLLLGVHIADVSHYVPEGSSLDREAFRRGNSVYFPDRAIPMLPARLSSGICSLNPGVDRLVFSVLMQLSPGGALLSSELIRGVIRSDARMTYTSVARILLENDTAERDRYRDLVPLFERMGRLCPVLQKNRRSRGAIDLDLPEAEVLLDSSGDVVNVVKAERNLAHQIIEEFMLLANETVAGRLERSGFPALYRIHEAPDPGKVREFAEIARLFGYTLRSTEGILLPADFQKLSDQLQQGPHGGFLSYLMLRSFALARYSEVNTGHFGLASPCYTHFTSPIRRYADLLVHRLLTHSLAQEGPAPTAGLPLEKLQEAAAQTSRTERIAADAEREMVDYYRAQLLSRCLGEEYEGFICNVISSGFFVQLDRHFVEGFVPAAFLEEDYFVYRQDVRALVGRNGKKMFRLGDRVRILVDSVDLDMRRILFSLA